MQIPPFNTYLGSEIVRREDGEAEVVLELQPHHLNRRGVAHGGVICALLDSALGAAVISSIPAHWWCATTSLSTQFLDGVGEGRVVASGSVVRRGRSVAFARGEVRDSRGRVIATASGTWHLWPQKPGTRPAGHGPYLFSHDGGRPIRVGKILAVGRNYAAHAVEMGAEADAPVVFLKPASALVHDGERIRLPAGAGVVHHEVELVVAIGRDGREIPEERALEHVLGYAVGLDLTLRELQTSAKERGEPWSVAKGFDGSAPVSVFRRREVVGDGSRLELRLEVNGETRQAGNSSSMLRGVPRLVSDLSRWWTLERGDLIFTGTPEGVGPVRPGDRLVASIAGVATLTVDIEP